MRAFLAILAFVLVAQVSAREVVIPSQPVSPYLDTEVSTNLLLTQAKISCSDLKFSFVGTRVNDLELSFGVDVNMKFSMNTYSMMTEVMLGMAIMGGFLKNQEVVTADETKENMMIAL